MELALISKGLMAVPESLGQLTNLRVLWLHDNQLRALPESLGQLTNLQALWLQNNQLTAVPESLGQLTKLQALGLADNRLTEAPESLGQLTNLQALYLHGNQLTAVPESLGQLTNLQELWLGNNQLTALPESLGQLTNLRVLELGGNRLASPPPEIVAQGTQAILSYLRGLEKDKSRQWVSKMVLVGEGGVGKTSLLRALRGDDFILGFETTYGVDIQELKLRHPLQEGVQMRLNTWDFGGQKIYHAPHQFFLTERSLFVLVWDARHGWEAGKLYYWLDTIQARAPESPVLVVAAHIDERDADLPKEDLQKKYPQIVGHYEVSNKTGEGIQDLHETIAETAAELPLMGEEWPANWLNAANAIRETEEFYISPKELKTILKKHQVKSNDEMVLTKWLHELGDILYYADDAELNDLVILDAEWVTQAVSKVLVSKKVIQRDGIFTRAHMDELWADIGDESIRQHLLRLMEKFDLSYRTLDNREISLVVERLPLDPPDYESKWNSIIQTEPCNEISMRYELSSLQAGLPTWFIARSHRFTTHTHWRLGALFADDAKEQHLALIEAYPHDRYMRLSVRGPMPNNFFVLLRDGLELTLARFPGLDIKRSMPCPDCEGRGKAPAHEFEFTHLLERLGFDPPKILIECPKCYAQVSVTGMLFGIDVSTQDAVFERMNTLEANVLERMEANDEEILRGLGVLVTEIVELRELAQREFLSLFERDQRLAESHCPNVFAILPAKEGGSWSKDIWGQKMILQLYCQAPGHWHPTAEGGHYPIHDPAKWLKRIGPYILKLSKVFKYAGPLIQPAAGVTGAVFGGPVGAAGGVVAGKALEHQVKLMEELAKKLKDEKDISAGEWMEELGGRGKAAIAEGAELRALREFLDEVDKKHTWGGLKKVLTPEGHYLWLCAEHAEEYKN